jgi:hypothetical protein
LPALRDLGPRPTPSKRSWACFKSASCSVCRSRTRFSASSSSSEESSSSSSAALLRRAASLCSSTLCDLGFLLAAASASALAFAAAALAAFSLSASESSASSQLSATWQRGHQYRFQNVDLYLVAYIIRVFFILKSSSDSNRRWRRRVRLF